MISIVDDDAAVRDSLRFLLECEGYETREFALAASFSPLMASRTATA
jgi:FixJ family two-component response regulator